MIRWQGEDPNRLHAQEMALLALCDRMTVLEQALTIEIETRNQLTLEQARRLAKQHDTILEQREAILRLEDQVRRLDATVRSLG
ncbi:MAG: hypothetical protein MUE52_04340 [Tabrizicola sp.]|jgi:hypothetical protein|nr:hypothetical protein [Tabrizicola sp.]